MGSLYLWTFWAALVASIIAAVLYWANIFSFKLALRRIPGSNINIFGQKIKFTALGQLVSSTGELGTIATCVAMILMVVSLVSRWQVVGHAPWANMWEFTLAFATAITLAYVIFERWHGSSIKTVGSIALTIVVTILVASAVFFPSDVRPLVPALQDQDLLAVHVSMMVISYGVLSVSFGAAILYLVQIKSGNRFLILPKAQFLDEIAYWSTIIGFPLLALGIALGAYWANSAWGRYWGWDPKETAALATLLIYAAYLHMRGLKNWTGTRSAVVLVVGFLAVLFTYFAVNLWVQGLHSYAGV